ncbi:uncharacterized protein AAEQ78_005699 isoform 3-T3 [Lycaon pictus]
MTACRPACLPAGLQACLEGAGGRWNRLHRAAPSHVPVALQATERRTPLPSSGRSTTNGRLTAARPTTTALTSSTGSVATTLPGQAGSLSSSWMTCGPMSSSTTTGRRRRETEATGGQGASRCRDEYEATAHLSTAVADIQMDASGQHGSPA